jgi:hypothetical protein
MACVTTTTFTADWQSTLPRSEARRDVVEDRAEVPRRSLEVAVDALLGNRPNQLVGPVTLLADLQGVGIDGLIVGSMVRNVVVVG